MGIHLAENLCSETFCSYNNTLGYAFSQRAFWPSTGRDTEFLADNGHVFVIQYRELESRKRRTKEEELSEELGLLSPQFRNGLYEPLRDPRGLHIE